jgi:hypothetical protein
MTRWPTTLERYVCQTLVALEKTATRIIPPTVHVSTPSSWPMIPESSALRSRNGLSIETAAEAMIITSTTVSRAR